MLPGDRGRCPNTMNLRGLKRFVDGVSTVMGAVCCAILVAMVLVVSVNVAMRYVFSAPITWADQVVTYALVYVSFLGAPFALAQRAHVSIDILSTFLRPQNGLRLNVSIDAAGILYCIAFTILAVQEMARLIERGSEFADAFIIPQWIVLVVLPLSGLLLAVQFFANLLADLDQLRAAQTSVLE